MKKIRKSGWTIWCASLIVALLNFLPCAADNAAAEPQDRKSEVRALRKECLELRAALIRSENELETARADFTQAYLELKKLRKSVKALRTKAANVLIEQKDVKASRTLEQVLKDMSELNEIQGDLKEQLRGLRRYLISLLEVLGKESDAALKAGLEGRLFLLERKLQEARQISRAPLRQAKKIAKDQSRVLDVNADLGAVILDIGREDGSRLGSSWLVKTGRKETLLQIIEVRPSLSAAVVVKGKIENIFAGSEAVRLTKSSKTKE